MGNEPPKKQQTKQLSQFQIDVACLKVKGYVELNRDRRTNQALIREKTLSELLRQPTRVKVDEYQKLQSLVQDVRFIETCNIVIRYCDIIKDQSIRIVKCQGDPQKIADIMPYIESILYAADNLNLQQVMEFKDLMVFYFGPGLFDTSKLLCVDPELKKLYKNPLPDAFEVNEFALKFAQKYGFSEEQLNSPGHQFSSKYLQPVIGGIMNDGQQNSGFNPNSDLNPMNGFGPSANNFGPPGGNNFGPGPNNFGPGPNNFGPGPNNFGPGPNNFGPGPNNFGPGPNNFGPAHNNFGPGPNNFGPGPNNFGPGPNNFGPGPNNFGPGPNNFEPGPNNFGPGPNNFGPPSNNFSATSGGNNFGPPPNNFGPAPNNFGPGPNNFGNNFGPGTSNPGQQNNQVPPPPGNFSQPQGNPYAALQGPPQSFAPPNPNPSPTPNPVQLPNLMPQQPPQQAQPINNKNANDGDLDDLEARLNRLNKGL